MARGVTSNSRASSPIEYSLPRSCSTALEGVLVLEPENVDVGIVRAVDQPPAAGGLVVVDIGIAQHDVGVAGIDLVARGSLECHAEGEPGAIAVGQAHAARF